jgi:hypothetical protein
MDCSPWQRGCAQRTVCQDVYGEAQDPRVETYTLSTWPSPLWHFFNFPKIKSALKGTCFESVDAVKAKATEAIKKLSEKDLRHCSQPWKIRMERSRSRGGGHSEGDNISIVGLVEQYQSGYFIAAIFWYVTLCCLVEVKRCFGGICWLRLQHWRKLSNTFQRSNDERLPDYKASYFRRHCSENLNIVTGLGEFEDKF